MVSGGQMPSQCPDRGRSPEIWAYKLLRTKHFHGVSSGNQPLYVLQSRYGKVRSNGVPWRRQSNFRPEGVQKTVDRYNDHSPGCAWKHCHEKYVWTLVCFTTSSHHGLG